MIAVGALLVAVLLAAPPAAAQCIGDCNGDGTVAIDELVSAAKIATASAPLASCASLDPSGNGEVGIDELIPAVTNLLDGCVALACPVPASVSVSILNRRGAETTATISGSETRHTCFPAASAATSYATSVSIPAACSGDPPGCDCGAGTCTCEALGPRCALTIDGLAPGEWRHAIAVPPLESAAPANAQRQYRAGLLMSAAGAPADVTWTAYRTVLQVTSAADDGRVGTLRSQVEAANGRDGQPPILIQFDTGPDAGPIRLTDPAPVVVTKETLIDGTDARGDPSPLEAFRERTYPTLIELDPRDKSAVQAAGLRFTAPRSGVRGLYIRRILGSDAAITRRDQDVVAFGRGAVLGRVETAKLDGGAAARRSQGCAGNARAPAPATNPAQGKDCVDVEDTGRADTRFAGAVTIENSELRHCYDRPVKSQNAEVVVRDSWIHHNLRGGPFAQNPNGRLRATRNLIEANGFNCPRASVCAGGPRDGQPCAPDETECPGPDDTGCGWGTCLPVDVSPEPSQCGVDAARPAAAQLSAERGTGAYLETDGNVLRDGLAAGVLLRDGASGRLRNDLICGMRQAGIQATAGAGHPNPVVVSGVASVGNGEFGVLLHRHGGTAADVVLGDLARRLGMNNAFTGNAVNVSLQGGGRTGRAAQNNQWQHGGDGARCDAAAVQRRDVRAGDGKLVVAPCQSPRDPTGGTAITSVYPRAARRGARVHIDGTGFNAVDGYSEGAPLQGSPCADVAAGNTCGATPNGTCVEFLRPGLPPLPARVVAVTPTHLVVESPLDCASPVAVQVRRQTPTGDRTFVSPPGIFCRH